MIKAILFDIDGTLRDERIGIPTSTKIAIQECRQKGIMIGICTGRTRSMIQDDVLNLNFDILISGDGSQIVYQQKILQDIYINRYLVKDILIALDNKEVGLAIETNQQVYMNQIACDILKKANVDKGITCLEKEKINYSNSLPAFDYHQMAVSKICIWSKNKVIEIKDIQYVQNIKTDLYYYYELIDRQAGKGKAISFIKEHLHLKKEEIMCFGDGMNDISMFEECGHAIAMQNSAKGLLEVASSICLATKEDGIYKELVKNKTIRGEM